MAEISGLLGIGEFSTSIGGTVRKEFIVAVAEALGVRMPYDPRGEVAATKETVTEWAWRQVNDGVMPREALSGGGTITNVALSGILEGIERAGINLSDGAPADGSEEDFGGEVPDISELIDSRKRAMREVYVREGQGNFRAEVMQAYDKTCAVTGTNIVEALEAAHIIAYRGRDHHHISNGLALRADIHALFDRGLMAIHEDTYEVILGHELATLEAYGDLDGRPIFVPAHPDEHPDPRYLRAHRIGSGFRAPGDIDI
ncbi:HNH endonuclease [Brachybacterium sp. AG952]|uniref:HNH endonuclease n=1 Tax=Brachybacterium sp. AG952 TaxID=2183989 RepID=UPI001060677C|nr:HNH endonuclease [Brachybacterium sp. AG952]TDP73625.1 HNH endonuclease [Brachybacterium sp. AG952]